MSKCEHCGTVDEVGPHTSDNCRGVLRAALVRAEQQLRTGANTCATCCFCAAPRESVDPPLDYKSPGWNPLDHDITVPWRSCTRIILGYDGMGLVDAIKEEKAIVLDGSGYAARLAVKPDFGCTLWEASKAP